MLFHSTRNKADVMQASQAIVQGISKDGGLYVPQEIPAFEKSLHEMAQMNYQELAYEVMRLYLTDFTEEELKKCISEAYGKGFEGDEPVELKKVGDDYFLELYHGRTIAFKDMALSILPYLMVTSARKNNVEDELVIVTATSGDTGKAALAGFADVENTRIIVFYPKDGVSAVQEKQMVSQTGNNVSVIAINGNFDDAQSAVKRMMDSKELTEKLAAAGFRFSSANSINIGRLVPQIVYYVYAYTRLLRDGAIADGEEINIVVPTGNFGNILAAYYAKRMGLPVHKLICASNENKVLYDFFQTGYYDRNRPFYVTTSPSMDILISSNLERLIFELTGEDEEKTASMMRSLVQVGSYEITPDMREKLDCFVGGFADIEKTNEQMKSMYERHHYVMDPHTAVADAVLEAYRHETGDDHKTVLASTASPYKFPHTVLKAVLNADGEDFALMKQLHDMSGMPIPDAVRDLENQPVLHTVVVDVDDIQAEVEAVLGLNEKLK